METICSSFDHRQELSKSRFRIWISLNFEFLFCQYYSVINTSIGKHRSWKLSHCNPQKKNHPSHISCALEVFQFSQGSLYRDTRDEGSQVLKSNMTLTWRRETAQRECVQCIQHFSVLWPLLSREGLSSCLQVWLDLSLSCRIRTSENNTGIVDTSDGFAFLQGICKHFNPLNAIFLRVSCFPREEGKIMFSPSQVTNGLNYNQTLLNSFPFFMVKGDSDGEFSRMPCVISVPENRRRGKNTPGN